MCHLFHTSLLLFFFLSDFVFLCLLYVKHLLHFLLSVEYRAFCVAGEEIKTMVGEVCPTLFSELLINWLMDC